MQRAAELKTWATANTRVGRKTQKREHIKHAAVAISRWRVCVPARGGEYKRKNLPDILHICSAHHLVWCSENTHPYIQTERGEWKAENKKRHPASQVFPRRQAIILDNTCSQPARRSKQPTNNTAEQIIKIIALHLAQNPPHHSVSLG